MQVISSGARRVVSRRQPEGWASLPRGTRPGAGRWAMSTCLMRAGGVDTRARTAVVREDAVRGAAEEESRPAFERLAPSRDRHAFDLTEDSQSRLAVPCCQSAPHCRLGAQGSHSHLTILLRCCIDAVPTSLRAAYRPGCRERIHRPFTSLRNRFHRIACLPAQWQRWRPE